MFDIKASFATDWDRTSRRTRNGRSTSVGKTKAAIHPAIRRSGKFSRSGDSDRHQRFARLLFGPRY
jgi:hypothetical protein